MRGLCCCAQVLEALQEIAFNPQFLPLRIEKERKAVMAEAQVRSRQGQRCSSPTVQPSYTSPAESCYAPLDCVVVQS